MALSTSSVTKSLQYSLGSVPMQQALWLQYIAVMLIILTFLIGSFCMKKEPSTQEVAKVTTENLPIGNYNLSGLFDADNKLNSELLAPFIQVLKSHDLLLRVELSVNELGLQDASATKAIEISQALLKQGLPAEAQQVVLLGKKSDASITLKLIKFEEPQE